MPDRDVRIGPSRARWRIGLLGGSFNPAHLGHRQISVDALKQLHLDEIWWLISPQNPLKSSDQMAPLPERKSHANSIKNHPKIRVTDIEATLGTRYTVDTLRRLKQRFPRTRFVWLMGADNLQQIPRWKKGLAIFEMVPVAVFHRPTYAAGRRTGKAAQRFDRAWHSPGKVRALALAKPPAWTVLNNRHNYLSATALRRK